MGAPSPSVGFRARARGLPPVNSRNRHVMSAQDRVRLAKRLTRDAKARGRHARCGEAHPAAYLTDHDVELMRQLHDEGLRLVDIARKFCAPWSTVRDICTYRTRL